MDRGSNPNNGATTQDELFGAKLQNGCKIPDAKAGKLDNHVRESFGEFVLFEPARDMACREVSSRTGGAVIYLIQLFHCVDKQITFFFAYRRKIATNSVTESHGTPPY